MPLILRQKVLGQAYPTAGTLTTLYTVPEQTSAWARCHSIAVCNQASEMTTFRVSIAIAGAADATKQYLYYDEVLLANDTFIAAIGVMLANTDVLRVYSANGQCSFQAFGEEAQ